MGQSLPLGEQRLGQRHGRELSHEYSRVSINNLEDESVSVERDDETPYVHMEREDLEVLEEGREDTFEHIGFGHLQALGAASASFGLISTLVFSLCIDSILSFKDISKPHVAMNWVCLATTFSVYTSCYSVLEYYYIQVFLGIESFLQNRVTTDAKGVHRERVKFVAEVRSKFSQFNTIRAAARNSLWLGLMSMVIACIVHLDPFELDEKVSSRAKTVLFPTACLLLVGPGWCIFGSYDLMLYTCISAIACVITFLDLIVVKSGLPLDKYISFLVLISNVAIVPGLVYRFRKTLVSLVIRHVYVY